MQLYRVGIPLTNNINIQILSANDRTFNKYEISYTNLHRQRKVEHAATSIHDTYGHEVLRKRMSKDPECEKDPETSNIDKNKFYQEEQEQVEGRFSLQLNHLEA